MNQLYVFGIIVFLVACKKENDMVVRQRPTTVTVDQFMGTQAFVDDPIDKMQCVGIVREYHNWNWDEGNLWKGGGNNSYPGYPDNQMKWAPSEAGGGGWNFDRYYAKIKSSGLMISPVIQGATAWLHGKTDFDFDHKPIDTALANTTDPFSYQAKAHHMYQFAARYGRQKINDSLLTLAPGQPRLSGLNLVQYVEDWNEQDKDWEGDQAYFSPEEYAAMCSADYDGHCNSMNMGTATFGVKNADPSMKLVMGGLAKPDLEYIKSMNDWFKKNRVDKKFAADVINVHWYSWADGKGPGGGGPAKSPEDDDLEGRMLEIVEFRDKYLPPQTEVWISEFGWDTNPKSPLRVPIIDGFDAEEIQGQWIVRAYLAFAAAGVDRAMQYMLRDVNASSSVQFSSSGLVTEKGKWVPKKSWYYVYSMKNILKGMKFHGKMMSSHDDVSIYKFKKDGEPGGAYVVWCPTAQNLKVNQFKLKISAHAKKVTLVNMEPGDVDGVPSELQANMSEIVVDVNERPKFILVDNME